MPKLSFAQIWFQIKKRFSFCLKIGWYTWYLKMLIFLSTIVFWISDPKTHFLVNLGEKVKSFLGKFRPKNQSSPFFLKIGTDGILRMQILISSLVLWISNRESILGKFRPKTLFVLPENWHTWYLENADSYFNVLFLNFKSKTSYWANLGKKSQIIPFARK